MVVIELINNRSIDRNLSRKCSVMASEWSMGKRSQKPGVFQTVLSATTTESAVGRKDVYDVCEKKVDGCFAQAENNK